MSDEPQEASSGLCGRDFPEVQLLSKTLVSLCYPVLGDQDSLTLGNILFAQPRPSLGL